MLGASLFLACKKDSPEPEEEKKAAVATSGKIVYKLDGKDVSYDGSGYILGQDYSFIKWENTKEQLSIDFYGLEAGDYVVKNAARLKGNAKIYYYPDNSPTNKIVWISKTGTFKVTEYQTTGGFKVSGSFSATLEKYNDNVLTGDRMEITAGTFKDIILKDAR